VLSLLTLWFGPQIVQLAGSLFQQHFYTVVGVVAITGLLLWVIFRNRKARPRTLNSASPNSPNE
jgi:hypothetical protein